MQAEFAEYEGKYGLAIKLYQEVTRLDKKEEEDPGFEGYPGIIDAIERCKKRLNKKSAATRA